MLLPMQETYKKIILRKRAKKRGVKLNQGPSGFRTVMMTLSITLLRPIHMLYTEVYSPLFLSPIHTSS
jgi:hypothetical protein